MADSPKSVNAFGVASFVFGILSLLVCWNPFLILLLIPLGLTGLVLGIAGVITSLLGQRSGLGWPLTGLTMCGCAFLVPLTMGLVFAAAIAATGKAPTKAGAADEAPVREKRPDIGPPPGAPPPVEVGDTKAPVAAPVMPDDDIKADVKVDIPVAPGVGEGGGGEGIPPGRSLYDAMMRERAGLPPLPPLPPPRAEEATSPAPPSRADSPRAETLLRSAQNLEKAGKTKGALDFYRRVVKEYPDSPQARTAAGRLKALKVE